MTGERPLEPKAEPKVDKKGPSIAVEDFIRSRDSIVTGLTTLIGVINDLNKAYLQHTNQLLSGAGAEPVDAYAISNFLQPANPINASAGGEKTRRKRVKKEKDPNALKRPLTAFFLYLTHARPLVKSDMGDGAAPVDINNEILRRWNNMPETEESKWKAQYELNNEQYKKEVVAYKAQKGLDILPGHDEEEVESVEDADAAAEDDESNENESEEEEVAPPAKVPSPPKARAGKGGKRKGKENGTAVHAASPSPSAQLMKETPILLPSFEPPKAASPEKRKRATRDDGGGGEEPTKKKKTRKLKSDDVKETTKVVAPSTDKREKKKKRKSDGA